MAAILWDWRNCASSFFSRASALLRRAMIRMSTAMVTDWYTRKIRVAQMTYLYW
ncbi:hypothetical protein SAMN05216233_105174 [Desulfoluna spongiiphila]|uniref:Uncharacterized protein n=1 Tax=Desulfoluna spongiiphila TaxID=419481 RepID=A0A1G5E6B9_9BACT|nr:hypothetical protein SAMN05216233_105174 [Desulfoluna spongiiphila]